MALGGIDLNLLVILQALLEEGNVTRAGARVGMPQPAMSNALARLRRHYKDELLLRAGNGYTLTPLARSLLPAVRESMRLIGDALTPGHVRNPPADRTFSITLSEYSIAVLGAPLLRRVHELAPQARIQMRPVATDVAESDRGMLLQQDLLIAPAGFWPGGDPEVVFRDRFVCVADPGNPRLRDGRLSLDDLRALPHATARFPRSRTDPVAATLRRLGVVREVVLTAGGWMPLPFLIAGTDMVAAVPERLARRVSEAAGVTVTEPPFGMIELIETAWWHPMHATDPALTWLRAIVRETVGLVDAGVAVAAADDAALPPVSVPRPRPGKPGPALA